MNLSQGFENFEIAFYRFVFFFLFSGLLLNGLIFIQVNNKKYYIYIFKIQNKIQTNKCHNSKLLQCIRSNLSMESIASHLLSS